MKQLNIEHVDCDTIVRTDGGLSVYVLTAISVTSVKKQNIMNSTNGVSGSDTIDESIYLYLTN